MDGWRERERERSSLHVFADWKMMKLLEVERTMHICYILELFGRHQQHTFCRSTDDQEAPGKWKNNAHQWLLACKGMTSYCHEGFWVDQTDIECKKAQAAVNHVLSPLSYCEPQTSTNSLTWLDHHALLWGSLLATLFWLQLFANKLKDGFGMPFFLRIKNKETSMID
jgi:hypothetical protein